MTQKPTPEENLKEIMKSSSYLLAEEDTGFLRLPPLRALRLQLEYEKPEFLLRQHGIRTTMVLFGGTRVVEQEVAQAKVDALRTALEQDPHDENAKRDLGIAERVLAKAPYYEVAREFAALVSEKSLAAGGKECVVITGGGPGIMEAGNRGAYESGAQSIGLNIAIPFEQEPNPYITPELCFQFHYFALRKMHFLMRARALVAFPGGFGTLDELFDALTLIQTHKIRPLPVVLCGKDFWSNVVNFDTLVEEGTISPEDLDLFFYADTATEIWSHIVNFYGGDPTQLHLPPSPTDRIDL